MLRKSLNICLIAFANSILLFFLMSTLSYASTVKIEGESYSSSNFTPGKSDYSAASGAKIQKLLTTVAAPTSGYTATYSINIATAGNYEFELITTPIWSTWASPYEYSINGSEYIPADYTNMKFISAVDSSFNKYHTDSVMLNQGTNTISFRVTDRRVIDNQYVFNLDYFNAISTVLEFKSIDGIKAMNVFSYGDALNLDIKLNGPVNSNTTVTWNITDYYNTQKGSGTSMILTGNSSVRVNAGSLPKGHYKITASISSLGLNIEDYFAVVTPFSQRQVVDDSPFAMDTAACWYVPTTMMDDFAEITKLTGVKWVRDRFNWTGVETTKNTFEYSYFDEHIDAFFNKGLKVLSLFHDAPSWARTGATNKLPSDLLATYDFAKNVGTHFGSKVNMWEVWNEEESVSTSSDESSDQYAAFLKAAAIGFHDSTGSSTPPFVTAGGMMKNTQDYSFGAFQKNMLENQILTFSDIYNFHNHTTYVASEAIIPYLKQYTDQHIVQKNNYPLGDITPVWTTEAGVGIPVIAQTDLTYVKQIAQARFMITSAATNIAHGVSKHFWFIGVPIVENSSGYGSLTSKFRPYPSYVAEAVMTEALGEGKYVGEILNMPTDAEGYVFKDGSSSILMLWSSSDNRISLNLEKPSGICTQIMGEIQTLNAINGIFTIDIGANPVYLRIDGDVPPNIINASQFPNTELAVKQTTDAQRIVLSQIYPEEARINSKVNNAYTLKVTSENTISVEVYNFNSTTMIGTVSGSAEGGWTVSAPQNVTIEPYSKTILSFLVNSTALIIEPNKTDKLTFIGNFGGDSTTTSVANIKREKCVVADPYFKNQLADQFNVDSSWTKNVGTWAIESGSFSQSNASTTAYATQKYAVIGDGQVSIDLNIQNYSLTDNWSGLVMRKQNATDGVTSSGYLVYLRYNGILGIYKGGVGLLGEEIPTGISLTSGVVNLSVVLKGNQIDVYVNNKCYATKIDNTFTNGYISLVSKSNHTHFDNFLINGVSISDSFTTDTQWTKNAGSWQVESGEFSQSNVTVGMDCYSTLPLRFSSGSVKADIKIVSISNSSNNYAGLVIRKVDAVDSSNTSGYLVYLKSNGLIGIKKSGVLIGSEVASGADPISSFVSLKAILDGGRIDVYVNGIIRITVPWDDTYGYGYISLATYNSHSHFDNFSIEQLVIGEDNTQYPVEINYIGFKNSNIDIAGLTNGLLEGQSMLKNKYLSCELPITFVLAWYSENKLKQVSFVNDSIPRGQSKPISSMINVSDSVQDSDYIKVFVLGDTTNLIPMTQLKVFSNAGIVQ